MASIEQNCEVGCFAKKYSSHDLAFYLKGKSCGKPVTYYAKVL